VNLLDGNSVLGSCLIIAAMLLSLVPNMVRFEPKISGETTLLSKYRQLGGGQVWPPGICSDTDSFVTISCSRGHPKRVPELAP